MTNIRSAARAARWLLTLSLAVVAYLLVPARPVAAHPLGNFTVNQYSRVEIGREEVRLFYVLDLAELPTVADHPMVDQDADGTISSAERASYLDMKLSEISPALHLTAGVTELPLGLTERAVNFNPGQAGLETTRIEATYVAPLREDTGELNYRNEYATDRLGWREIVVVNGVDISIEDAENLAIDRSHELRTYPDDLLSSPVDERSATIKFAWAPGAPSARGDTSVTATSPLGMSDRLSEIVNGATVSTTGMLLALLAAAVWGALHALSPGHGKTVVGAYLVGSRGTPRHALFLGLTVTITHTAGVIALGLVILFASQTIMPEQLYPWLSLASGLLVAAIGITILRQRLLGLPAFGHHHHGHAHSHNHEHDHVHEHTHDHANSHTHDARLTSHDSVSHSHLPPGAEGEPITWRSLLALGISGGLLPCPSALLALLGAIAVGRAGFGLFVVIAFSLGLAATLTGVGLLFLYAGRLLERRTVASPLAGAFRYAPAAAALAVTASGVMIAARALIELQRF
jgi:ABC-type nickel/cobalt efflux system permease component RcnA